MYNLENLSDLEVAGNISIVEFWQAFTVELLRERQLFAVSKGSTDLSDKMVEFHQLFEREIGKHKSQRR